MQILTREGTSAQRSAGREGKRELHVVKQQERFPKEENEVPTAGCQNRGHKTPKNSTKDKRGYKNKAITASTEVLDLQ